MVNGVTEGCTDEDYGENEDWTGEEGWTDWTGAVTDESVDGMDQSGVMTDHGLTGMHGLVTGVTGHGPTVRGLLEELHRLRNQQCQLQALGRGQLYRTRLRRAQVLPRQHNTLFHRSHWIDLALFRSLTWSRVLSLAELDVR